MGLTVDEAEGLTMGFKVGEAEGFTVGFADGVVVGFKVGEAKGVAVGLREGFAVGMRVDEAVGAAVGLKVGEAEGIAVGLAVGLDDGQPIRAPNCTSNPLGPPSFWTVKVMVVIAPKPHAVKDDNPATKPLSPLKEVTLFDAVPLNTSTESRRSSAAK